MARTIRKHKTRGKPTTAPDGKAVRPDYRYDRLYEDDWDSADLCNSKIRSRTHGKEDLRAAGY